MFLRVIDCGSMTRAADELGLELSSVSHTLSRLERGLGWSLIDRGMRGAVPTHAGQIAYARMQALLQDFDALQVELDELAGDLVGPVRVYAAPGFGAHLVTHWLLGFKQLHPRVNVDLWCPNRRPSFRDDEVDIVFRYGPITEEGVVPRRIGTMPFVACASPDYLRGGPLPLHPRELDSHVVINYSGYVRPTATFMVNRSGERFEFGKQRSIGLDNVLAMRQAVLAGAGIWLDAPAFLCDEELASGRLMRVLPGWEVPAREEFVLRRDLPNPPRRVTALVDWLCKQWQATPCLGA